MKLKEFTQKHSVTFFVAALIFFVATVVLGAGMVMHQGPRGFGGTRTMQADMMQKNGWQMQDGRHRPMQGNDMQTPGAQAPADGTTNTVPAPTTN